MNKALILILLPLFLMGCSHNQLGAYLLVSDTKKSEETDPGINRSDIDAALIVKSDSGINLSDYDVALIIKSDSGIYLSDFDVALFIKSDPGINLSDYYVALIIKSDPVLVIPVNQSMIAAMPVMNSFHPTDDDVLDKARKDLVAFYITARHLRMSNITEDLEIFTEVTREYLSKRIAPLLKDRIDKHAPDIQKALTEVQFLKAHLLYEIEDLDGACEAVSDFESRNHHEADKGLEVVSERFSEYGNPNFVLADFSHMCK